MGANKNDGLNGWIKGNPIIFVAFCIQNGLLWQFHFHTWTEEGMIHTTTNAYLKKTKNKQNVFFDL